MSDPVREIAALRKFVINACGQESLDDIYRSMGCSCAEVFGEDPACPVHGDTRPSGSDQECARDLVASVPGGPTYYDRLRNTLAAALAARYREGATQGAEQMREAIQHRVALRGSAESQELHAEICDLPLPEPT